ncbi:hypothetical protein [Anthocerotibacter panamensis]|uniref:hypothetical protein n=1 Tax=Anthocerotibacter panamensis TaxID=2857077 RepID=UPI001C405078|nr:hypothetical protein [Anthocerotibacter panamensis]
MQKATSFVTMGLVGILGMALLLPGASLAQLQDGGSAPGQFSGGERGQDGGRGRDGGRGGQFMRTLKGLNLSSDQKAQVRQMMEAFRASGKGDPSARQKLRSDIESILTPEQRNQLRQNQQGGPLR